MNSSYTYLLIDFCCFIVPFVFSFHPRLRFIDVMKPFVKSCLLTAFLFVTWDVLFTHLGVWSFNKNYVTGIYVLNLPLEEVLFFICIPYASVFTYHSFSLYLPNFERWNARKVTLALAIALIVIGSFNTQKLYTSVTFFSLALFLTLLAYLRVNFFALFYITFLVILIPFFISNGALTGSFTDEPVVMYNEKHNLGVRLFTIPLEDLFYGMLLLIMNVSGFEYFKNHERRVSHA